MAEITSPFKDKLFNATINDNGSITLNPEGGFINDETPLDEYNMNLLVKAILENKHNMESSSTTIKQSLNNEITTRANSDKAINNAAFGTDNVPTDKDSLQKQITDEKDNRQDADEKLYGGEIPETNLTIIGINDKSINRDKYITGLDSVPISGNYSNNNEQLRTDLTNEATERANMDEYLYGGKIPGAEPLTMKNINSDSINRDKSINRAAFGNETTPTSGDSLQTQINANKKRLDELDNTYATDQQLDTKAKYITGLTTIPTSGTYNDSNTKLRNDLTNEANIRSNKDNELTGSINQLNKELESLNFTILEINGDGVPTKNVATWNGEYDDIWGNL